MHNVAGQSFPFTTNNCSSDGPGGSPAILFFYVFLKQLYLRITDSHGVPLKASLRSFLTQGEGLVFHHGIVDELSFSRLLMWPFCIWGGGGCTWPCLSGLSALSLASCCLDAWTLASSLIVLEWETNEKWILCSHKHLGNRMWIPESKIRYPLLFFFVFWLFK